LHLANNTFAGFIVALRCSEAWLWFAFDGSALINAFTCNLCAYFLASIINRDNIVVVALCTYCLVVAGALSSTRMALKGGACVLGDWTFNVYAEIPALAITFSIANVFTRILVFVVTLALGWLEWV
jgi:hypothetical protein